MSLRKGISIFFLTVLVIYCHASIAESSSKNDDLYGREIIVEDDYYKKPSERDTEGNVDDLDDLDEDELDFGEEEDDEEDDGEKDDDEEDNDKEEDDEEGGGEGGVSVEDEEEDFSDNPMYEVKGTPIPIYVEPDCDYYKQHAHSNKTNNKTTTYIKIEPDEYKVLMDTLEKTVSVIQNACTKAETRKANCAAKKLCLKAGQIFSDFEYILALFKVNMTAPTAINNTINGNNNISKKAYDQEKTHHIIDISIKLLIALINVFFLITVLCMAIVYFCVKQPNLPRRSNININRVEEREVNIPMDDIHRSYPSCSYYTYETTSNEIESTYL